MKKAILVLALTITALLNNVSAQTEPLAKYFAPQGDYIGVLTFVKNGETKETSGKIISKSVKVKFAKTLKADLEAGNCAFANPVFIENSNEVRFYCEDKGYYVLEITYNQSLTASR